MIDLDILKDHGYTQAVMKSAFTAKKPSDKIKKLTDKMRNRILPRLGLERTAQADISHAFAQPDEQGVRRQVGC